MNAQDTETRRVATLDTGPGPYEQKVAARLAAAGYRMRHDKVARRLVEGVRAGIAQEALKARTIVFAVTAPIRHPAKTINTLISLLPDVAAEGLRTTVHGNKVHARQVAGVSSGTAGVFGFVHNPDYEAGLILDLAKSTFNDG